jgi:DNA-binding transcriptional regulator YiaG
MMTPKEHSCDSRSVEYTSTAETPYHYVNSGLEDVYLVGVPYRVCKDCNKQSADIPALKCLLAEIASRIVEKPSLLNGSEIRFLRKQIPMRAIDFAAMMSITPQRLSALESTDGPVPAGRDKIIRLIYEGLCGDKRFTEPEAFQKWMTSIHGNGSHERIIATWQENHKWKVEPIAA